MGPGGTTGSLVGWEEGAEERAKKGCSALFVEGAVEAAEWGRTRWRVVAVQEVLHV